MWCQISLLHKVAKDKLRIYSQRITHRFEGQIIKYVGLDRELILCGGLRYTRTISESLHLIYGENLFPNHCLKDCKSGITPPSLSRRFQRNGFQWNDKAAENQVHISRLWTSSTIPFTYQWVNILKHLFWITRLIKLASYIYHKL